jgi:hypothetical protein
METVNRPLSVLQRKWAGLSIGQEVEGNLLSLVNLLDHHSKIQNILNISLKNSLEALNHRLDVRL